MPTRRLRTIRVDLQSRDYSRDLRLAKWESGVGLRGSNLDPFMSGLGQKQTSG